MHRRYSALSCHSASVLAVKRRACASDIALRHRTSSRGSILAGYSPISRAKFRRIFAYFARQNKRKKIETFVEICKRETKEAKGKLETFRAQSLFKYGYPVDLLQIKKVTRFKNTVTYWICVVFSNLSGTVWF